jgi:hypothetical protein
MTPGRQRIERIVLPLDTAAEIVTAIDTAVRLAERWHVPLAAVFVEDEELWQLAGLPFARQVTLLAGSEALTRADVTAHFRAFEERIRQAVASAAARHHVEWTFATVHGSLGAAGLGEHDFIVAGAATRPIGRHFRLKRRSRRPPDSAHSLLLARRDWLSGGSVMAILKRRDAAAMRLLNLAGEIAGFGAGRLDVLAAPDPAGPAALAAWVADVLEGHSLELATEMARLDPDGVRHRLVTLDCRLVALAEDHAELDACFAECDVLTVGAAQ